jgi:hypothetical protein
MTSLLSTILTECRYFKYQRNEFIDSKQQDLPHYAICPQGKWKTDCKPQRVAQRSLQNKWRWRCSGYEQPVPKGQSEGEPTKQDSITLHLEDSILQINTNWWKYDRRYRRPYKWSRIVVSFTEHRWRLVSPAAPLWGCHSLSQMSICLTFIKRHRE